MGGFVFGDFRWGLGYRVVFVLFFYLFSFADIVVISDLEFRNLIVFCRDRFGVIWVGCFGLILFSLF